MPALCMLYNHTTADSFIDITGSPVLLCFLSTVTDNEMKPLFLLEEMKSPLPPNMVT